MSAILNSILLDSAILNKIKFTHSFSLNFKMAAIFNSTILDSATAILDSVTLLLFTQIHSITLLLALCHRLKLIEFWLMLDSATAYLDDGRHLVILSSQNSLQNLDSAIFHSDSGIQTNSIWLNCDDGSHSEFCHLGFNQFETKKNFTHLFWLNF